MKIGIDLRTLQEGKITGVEVYSRNLIQALIKLDDSNEYMLFYNSYRHAPSGLDLAAKENVSYAHFRFPNRLLNLSLLFFRQPKIDRLLGGLDIFFSPRYLFTALTSQCKLVVVMHDLSFIHFPYFFSKKRLLWHSLLSDKSACKRAHAVIAVSDATQQDIISTFEIEKKKVFSISPGLDHLIYSPGENFVLENDIRVKYRLSRPFVLYQGTIEPRKNILGIVSAFELIKLRRKDDLELVLAGGLGWLYRKLLRTVKQSPFHRDIKLLGQIPENFKAPLYRMAEAVIFPSFFEGFGFPPLEAMACGTPVVVGHNSSLNEVVGDAALLVNPYDAGQIALGLESILSDPALKTAYSNKGIIQAKKFTWEKTALEVLKIFTALK